MQGVPKAKAGEYLIDRENWNLRRRFIVIRADVKSNRSAQERAKAAMKKHPGASLWIAYFGGWDRVRG